MVLSIAVGDGRRNSRWQRARGVLVWFDVGVLVVAGSRARAGEAVEAYKRRGSRREKRRETEERRGDSGVCLTNHSFPFCPWERYCGIFFVIFNFGTHQASAKQKLSIE